MAKSLYSATVSGSIRENRIRLARAAATSSNCSAGPQPRSELHPQASSTTFIDTLLPVATLVRRIARDVALIIRYSPFTALMARISMYLPSTLVPITGQTLAVLLAGAALVSWKGAAALVHYLAEGTQLPVFAGGWFGIRLADRHR